jgi:membrane-associated phospholipid phosphatase
MKMFSLRSVACVFCATVVLMVVGTIYDLQISTALYNASSPLGLFFAALGNVPVVICAWVGVALWMVSLEGREGTSRASLIFLILVAAAGSVLAFREAYEALPLGLAVAAILVEIALSVAIALWVYREADRSDLTRVARIALVIIAASIISAAVVHLIKIPWGRPRFRSVVVTEGLDFRPWYLPGHEARDAFAGILPSEEFKSFPSGHSAMAALACILSALTLVVPKLKERQNALLAVALVWTICVMISRIVAGAHFLTDVTMGATLSYLSMLLAWRLFGLKENAEVAGA